MGPCQSKKQKSSNNDQEPQKTITSANDFIITKSDFITQNEGKFRDNY